MATRLLIPALLAVVGTGACTYARPEDTAAPKTAIAIEADQESIAPSQPNPSVQPTRSSHTARFEDFSVSTTELPSPGKEYTARVTTGFPLQSAEEFDDYFSQLAIVGQDGEHVVLEEWRPWRLGYSIPELIGWSKDGEWLYYANRVISEGCQPYPFYTSVSRVGVPAGDPQLILPDVSGSAAISPDSTSVALTSASTIRVLAIDGVQTSEMDLGYGDSAQVGALAWSPTADKLAASVALDPCAASGDSKGSMIIVTSISSPDPRVAATFPDGIWSPVAWPLEQYLIVRDPANALHALDLTSGSVSAPFWLP